MHYNKTTETVGNENTRKAKITIVSQHRMPDYKKCASSFFLKTGGGAKFNT